MCDEVIFKFTKGLVKTYVKDSDIGCFFGADLKYFEQFGKWYNYLPFLLVKIKFDKHVKFVSNVNSKVKYLIHIIIYDLNNLKMIYKF